MRGVAVLGLLAVAACGPAPSPPSPSPEPPPLDYTGWSALTPKPVTIKEGLYAWCTLPPEAKRLGPHFAPLVRYLVNPAGEAAVRNGPFPVPVGTVVVKTKAWPREDGVDEWFAAMIKREPGYDPGSGDWEYLLARKEDGRWQTERGKIERCAGCHQQAVGTDYLFRGYLKP